MRIRSTKPEFWRSKTIAQLDWDVRLVLKGLESFVDDNGVGKDDIALIAADVFPRDLSGSPLETLRRLTEAVSTLAEAGLIVRYELDGEQLLYVDKWKDIQYVQKPKAGRFRRPDGTLEYSETVDRESYRNGPEVVRRFPEVVAPGTGEQGNRGTGEQGNSSGGGAEQVTHLAAVPVAPPKKCPRHIDDPNPPDCGACASLRRAAEAVEARSRIEAATEARTARDAEQAVRDQQANCETCQGTGFVDNDAGDAVLSCPAHPRIKDVVAAHA